ncbi:proline-rich protein 23A-like [Vulpes vulpes]|uniref:Proline-rich protein 23A-like n=1 Tax=Vulpes vulpes TaxID=9627 RepID=A0A3Q7TX57_VULVU
MGSRPRSPSAQPEPCWGPPRGGPGPAKRRRSPEPEGPQGMEGPPAAAAGALASVVVLAAGSALQLLLDDVDLVLEPEPTSVLQVSLGGLTLLLVPEALLRAGGQGHPPAGPEQGAVPSAPGHPAAVQHEAFCASVPDVAAQEEACAEDADPELPPPRAGPTAGWAPELRACAGRVAPGPGPRRLSPLRYFDLDPHLLEPFPGSPLRPLPPSPSPGPHVRPQRPPGPSPKARRRLFPE